VHIKLENFLMFDSREIKVLVFEHHIFSKVLYKLCWKHLEKLPFYNQCFPVQMKCLLRTILVPVMLSPGHYSMTLCLNGHYWKTKSVAGSRTLATRCSFLKESTVLLIWYTSNAVSEKPTDKWHEALYSYRRLLFW